MITRRRGALIAALAATSLLAACSGGSDTPDAPENDVEDVELVEDEAPVENLIIPEPVASPTPTPTPVTVEAPPADEQILEDAESVGMTARVQRGEETAPVQ